MPGDDQLMYTTVSAARPFRFVGKVQFILALWIVCAFGIIRIGGNLEVQYKDGDLAKV